MEAQACSKPVITSDISGCRDVIIENKTGYLVRPQDADDLANKILFMLANIESYDVLAKNAYDHAREKFSLDSAVSQHIEIFNNITI
jgi:glycosyltransferase involved in cell wall biosynthesis